MAQNDYARLAGEHVALSGDAGPFRLCPACGNDEGVVGSGCGPHLAAVACLHCDMHISWLGRSHLDAILAKTRGAA